LEQRVAERTAALQRSNEDLQQFAHVVSHDLKEPLRGLHNYAHLLLEDLGNTVDGEARVKLQTLVHLSQRMEDLINSLLHFCLIGQEHLAVEETDLNTVLQEVLALLHITLTEQDVDVRVPRPLPVIRCDPARVREVLHNLITNAVKYNNKPHKWVEVGFDVASGAVRMAPGYTFYVRDNGIGIRSQHLETIFAMFKRLHPRDAYGGGSGAGLAMVKKIVERHGGTIWVESTYGEGSTFYFTLQGDTTHHGRALQASDPPDRRQC
jgi:light-regulated signal transduction histidine kinase (bacteriophytochrome)